MPSSTSSIGRYPSYSLYSSYPSYRSSSSSSSYLNRTTSLDRSSYSSGNATSSINGINSYYNRYSGGSKALSTLPPRPSYSSVSDTYRSSRSVRASPGRTSYGRLSSDSSLDRESVSSRYISSSSRDSASRESGYYGSSSRESGYYGSSSRESGYYGSSSNYTPSSKSSIDYSSTTNGDSSRRGSFYRRDSGIDDDTLRVSERIRALEGWKDPVEERLAQRRRRLGLSPTRDTSGSRSPKLSSLSSLSGRGEDNRRNTYGEENGNDSTDDSRPSVTDLCRMYSSNMNVVNGVDSSLKELSGCSGGAGPSLTAKDSITEALPEMGVEKPSSRSKQNSNKEEITSSPLGSPKTKRRPSPEPKSSQKDEDSQSKTISSCRTSESELSKSSYNLPFRTKDRRERMKERIALRLASEVQQTRWSHPRVRLRSPKPEINTAIEQHIHGGRHTVAHSSFRTHPDSRHDGPTRG